MRTLTSVAVFTACLLGLGGVGQAMPAMNTISAHNEVVQVSGGCGPGGHRTPYGRCVPNYGRPVYRGCPPGLHENRFGRCRPNF